MIDETRPEKGREIKVTTEDMTTEKEEKETRDIEEK